MVKVLVIKPSSLGDIVHAAEGVERLARSRADCELDWLVNSAYADFVREFPGVRDVVPFERQNFRAGRASSWLPTASRLLRRIRGRYDVVVDLQGLQRSGLMARSCAARERWGLSSARELAWIHYNRRVHVPGAIQNAIDRVLFVVDRVLEGSAFLQPSTIARSEPFRLPVPAWARAEADRLLGHDPRPVLVACPGARWASKLWPTERWSELLQLLGARREELRTVFLGAPGEESLVTEPAEHASSQGVDTSFIENLVGRAAIWTTAALFERAAVAFTMDSAPLHLAAAVGAATVSLGPTDPERVAPRGPAHRRVIEPLECLRCYERACPLSSRVCLPAIDANRVLSAIDAALRDAAARPSGSPVAT